VAEAPGIRVARGIGPPWLRLALVGVACVYYLGLFVAGTRKTPITAIPRWAAFFVEAPGLFPFADRLSFEFKLDGWACSPRAWVPIDPRAYFPIEADNKESRFQRLVWFYRFHDNSKENLRAVMNAIDDYVIAHHADVDDGYRGELGGIRVYEVYRDLPPPGADVARYASSPLAPLAPGEQRKEIFNTKPSARKKRCKTGGDAP
jgi:hypothetical protein